MRGKLDHHDWRLGGGNIQSKQINHELAKVPVGSFLKMRRTGEDMGVAIQNWGDVRWSRKQNIPPMGI